LKEAVCAGSPQAVGLSWANWCWKAVSEFVQERFDILLGRTACIDWLHRLGFVRKRPGKRLLKADAEKRTAFVTEYEGLRREAKVTGTKIFFVDEAHFRADVELRQLWSLRGKPALVDSTSPRRGEKATYYSAVCIETGEIDAMSIAGTCTAETTVAFLKQLREHHTEPLIIIWDNGPAHRGPELRSWLSTPNLRLRLVPLPAYSPDFNADEAVWNWAREVATANICFGTKDKVEQAVDAFFARITSSPDEAMRRCRTLLQAQADALPSPKCLLNVDPIPVSL
jgi:transposase